MYLERDYIVLHQYIQGKLMCRNSEEDKELKKELERRGIRTLEDSDWAKVYPEVKDKAKRRDLTNTVAREMYLLRECTCGGFTYRKGLCEDCVEAEDMLILHELLNIGFCQPKFYKPTIWKYAKEVMEIAVANKLAENNDLGRGKGKYASHFTVGEIATQLIEKKEVRKIVNRYQKNNQKLS